MDTKIIIFLAIILIGNISAYWFSYSLAERNRAIGMTLILNMISLTVANLFLGLWVGSLENFYYSLLLTLPVALVGGSLFWLGFKESLYISLVWVALVGISNFLPGLPFFKFYFVYISGIFDSPYLVLAIGYFLFISPAISNVIAQGSGGKMVSSRPIFLAGFSTLILIFMVITNPLIGASYEAGKVVLVQKEFAQKYPAQLEAITFEYKPEKEMIRPFFLFYPFIDRHVIEYTYLGHRGNVLLEDGRIREGFNLLLKVLEGRQLAKNQLEHLLGSKLDLWFDPNVGWAEGDKLFMRYDGQVFPPLFGRFMFEGVLFGFQYNDQGLIGVPHPMLDKFQNPELFPKDSEE